MKKIKLLLGLSIILLIVLSSCLKDLSEEKRKEEQDNINAYILANNIPQSSLLDEGIYLVINKESNPLGVTPDWGDLIIINYTVRTLKEGYIFDTNDSTNSKDNISYPLDGFIYGPHKVYLSFQLLGLNYAFLHMKEGDSATAIIPSYLAYNDYVTLIADVELVDVIEDPDTEISEFFTNEVLPTIDYDFTDTVTGLGDSVLHTAYISFTDDNTIDDLDTLTYDEIFINFSGYYIEDIEGVEPDRKFNTYESYDALQDEYSILPSSLKKILHKLPISSSVRVYLPYTIAFKKDGLAHPHGFYLVPPYTSIYYDIYVEDKVEY